MSKIDERIIDSLNRKCNGLRAANGRLLRALRWASAYLICPSHGENPSPHCPRCAAVREVALALIPTLDPDGHDSPEELG